MSLSKQLMLLISGIFLAIFAVNFYSSINNIKSYLEVESEVHAQDTATALGLSLAPYILEKEDPILETMINTIFDRGYFLEIRLSDMDNNELVRKRNPATFDEVPAWFVERLPMSSGSAFSDIDSGWMIGGRVEVWIHPGFGYLKLWNQFNETLRYSAMLFIISLALLALVIRTLLAPLQRIRAMAERIGEGKYERLDPLPWTAEMRSVANSMNLMSGKIERIVGTLNQRLSEADDRLHADALTGLPTKVRFESQIKEMIEAGKQGYLFTIRMDNLGEYASRHSSAQVDGYIRAFANAVKEAAAHETGGHPNLYRLVGSEFALISDAKTEEAAQALAQRLCRSFDELTKEYEIVEVGHVGGVMFDSRSTITRLLAGAAESYEKSRMIGANQFALNATPSEARSIEEWNRLVARTIESESFYVQYNNLSYALEQDGDSKVLIEEAFADVRDENNEPVPVGTFVSIAETTQRVEEFDLKVIRRVIDRIRVDGTDHPIAVNLSLQSIRSNRFRQSLYELLQNYQSESSSIAFSLSAYAASQDIPAFISFIEFAHRAGTSVMLKRFESKQFNIDSLSGHKLDYIRIARHYTEDISNSPDKRQMVEALQELGHLLDIKVHAESVGSEADIETLRQIGLAGASRREE